MQRQVLCCVDPDDATVERTQALMTKYGDLPMDFADASLVALDEHRNDSHVFTLDSDFSVYRLHGRRAFRLVPALR